MKIYKSPSLDQKHCNGVIAIGNFDGLHKGHEKLLKVSKKIIKIGKKVKINFVKDRPGHDIRYALNSNKIKKKLGWSPKTDFKKGIQLTLDWYFENKSYYKSLSKKDINNRLGKGWSKKELF